MSNSVERSHGFGHRRKIFMKWPTPLHRLANLTEHLGGPDIFVKREDMCGTGLGGNKTRKLEYLLGEALAQGHTRIVTGGALQSNHVAQTAIAAAIVGLGCDVVLMGNEALVSRSLEWGGNRFLNHLSGARSHRCPAGLNIADAINALADEIGTRERRPYSLPFGGSSALGALGLVDCISELVHQAPDLAARRVTLVHASGSGGTQAGLMAGVQMHGLDWRVLGFAVKDTASIFQSTVDALAAQTLAMCGHRSLSDPSWIDDRARGRAYGLPTEEAQRAIELLLRLEGLVLDPVYTGKAMAGLIDAVRSGEFDPDDPLIFMHTGGAGGLFGYQDIVGPEAFQSTSFADTIS